MKSLRVVNAEGSETVNLAKGALQKEQTGAIVLSLFVCIILETQSAQYSCPQAVLTQHALSEQMKHSSVSF
jgi:hypothetical protein